MAVVKGRKRKRKGTKRFDPSDLKEILKDRRSWNVLATVIVPDEQDSHFELVVKDGVLVDILVDVVTHPGGVELTCRLKGGSGAGIIEIPNVDDEVIVAIPEGQIEFCPTIVAFLSSQSIPNPTGEGPALNRTVIVNGEVMIHDGTGGTEPLCKKSEFDGHTHTTTGGTTGSAATIGGAAAITGTTVLKAK